MMETQTNHRSRRARLASAHRDSLNGISSGLGSVVTTLLSGGLLVWLAAISDLFWPVLGILALAISFGPFVWALGHAGYTLEAVGAALLLIAALVFGTALLGVLGALLIVLSPLLILGLGYGLLSGLFFE